MSDSAVRACFPLTTGPSGRKRARTRSPSPGSNVPPAKRTTQSRPVPVTPPPASPDADDPPLFLVTASPSAIVDDSHYSSFGHGFSYEYHGADLSRHGLGEPLVPLGEQASKQESPAAVNLNHLIPVAACFNCGSPGHQLSDCPFVCDQATISASRERFRSEKAELSALGSVPSRRLGAITVGSDSPHQRFLDYADRFKPGVVSDELGSALGYGADADRFVTREYPWMYRILEYGYPRGWTMRAGDQGLLGFPGALPCCASLMRIFTQQTHSREFGSMFVGSLRNSAAATLWIHSTMSRISSYMTVAAVPSRHRQRWRRRRSLDPLPGRAPRGVRRLQRLPLLLKCTPLDPLGHRPMRRPSLFPAVLLAMSRARERLHHHYTARPHYRRLRHRLSRLSRLRLSRSRRLLPMTRRR